MYVIGLTGGIACGKSTVSEILRGEGAAIVDADAIAHALSMPGASVFNAYVEQFGTDILTPDGTLDRAAIARRIFVDHALRDAVHARVHPLIRAAAEEQLEALRSAGTAAAVLDVPLLFEAGWDAIPDETWVVMLPEEEQLARLCARNPLMSEREARARIAAQMPLTEKCARADVIIDNSGTKEETQQRVKELWRERIIERA